MATSAGWQYLYCNSQPHELTGLYASGATCANQTGQVYASSFDSWGNVTSRTYSGTTSTLTYDLLAHFASWNNGTREMPNKVRVRQEASFSQTPVIWLATLSRMSYYGA